MKMIFILLILTILIIACNSSNNCEDFRTGKFTYTVMDSNWVVERNDSLQTEYCEELGVNMELKISWINQCTYMLKFNRFLQNEAGFPSNEKHVVHSTIISSGKDHFITLSEIKGTGSNKYKFTRIK